MVGTTTVLIPLKFIGHSRVVQYNSYMRLFSPRTVASLN